MHEVAIPLFISVEQIAEAIKQMAPPDLTRLFELVPSLQNGHVNQAPVQAGTQITETTVRVRAELMESPNYHPLTGDEPFRDGLTLDDYLNLSENKQAQLWDQWAGSCYDLEEVELAGIQSQQKLSDFFQNSPLAGVEIDLERDKNLFRENFVL